MEEVTADFAGKQMERNCFGAVNTLNAVLPEMRRQHSGCVLFASSPAARVPMQSHCSASRYALEALVMALRLEMAAFGVRVSVGKPGDTKQGYGEQGPV